MKERMINIIEEEMYYITNEDNSAFVSNGLRKVNSISKAGLWLIDRSNNILANLPRSLCLNDRWHKEILKKDDKEEVADFMNFDEFEDKIKKFYELSEEFNKYDKSLNTHYKIIELELCDLYHYIENSNFDVVRGYRAYLEIRNALKKRRHIKDEQMLLDNLKESTILGCNSNRVYGSIEGLKNRVYSPRIRSSLFKDNKC